MSTDNQISEEALAELRQKIINFYRGYLPFRKKEN